MRKHDASAYARASAEHAAPAHATYVRTDVLTQMHSPREKISPNASRAGGLNDSSTRSRHNTARTSRFAQPSDLTGVLDRSRFADVPSFDPARNVPFLRLLRTSNAQSSPGRPLIREDANCTSTATRRTETGKVAVPRHRFIEAACSPVARWRGESDGSNPLRPPATRPAAGRCEVDRASVSILRRAVAHVSDSVRVLSRRSA